MKLPGEPEEFTDVITSLIENATVGWLSVASDACVLHCAACVSFGEEGHGELNRFNIGGVIHHLSD